MTVRVMYCAECDEASFGLCPECGCCANCCDFCGGDNEFTRSELGLDPEEDY